MTDLKTLYHQPELMSTDELKTLRRKVAVQGDLKYYFAAASALTMGAVDLAMHKTLRFSQVKIASAFAFGYFVGGYGASRLTSTWI